MRLMGPPRLDEATAARVVAAVRSLLGRYETQTALAKDLGVTQSAISQWLRGAGRPSYTNAVVVARLTGRSVADLLALPHGEGDHDEMGTVLEGRPNLRAAVDLYRAERPLHEDAVRAVVAAARHLPDLDRGVWWTMLEQTEQRRAPDDPPVKPKNN